MTKVTDLTTWHHLIQYGGQVACLPAFSPRAYSCPSYQVIRYQGLRYFYNFVNRYGPEMAKNETEIHFKIREANVIDQLWQ